MDAFDPQLRARYQDRLAELNLEHRDLDAAIHRLVQDPWHDQLLVKRLKRRKLLLKDQIAIISRQLDPDVPA